MLEISQTVESSKFEKGGNSPDPMMKVRSGSLVEEFRCWRSKNQGYLFSDKMIFITPKTKATAPAATRTTAAVVCVTLIGPRDARINS